MADTFETDPRDLALMIPPEAVEEAEEWSRPSSLYIEHAGCGGNILFWPDRTDWPLSYYECGCRQKWPLHEVRAMSSKKIAGLFLTKFVEENVVLVEKLVEVEERGLRFFALRTATDEDLKSGKVKRLEALRSTVS